MLLDTNALSAFADGDAGLTLIVKRTELIAIPVIALGEYRFGIRQSRRREFYEKWLDVLITQCAILSVDEVTSMHYAVVRSELKKQGRPIPANDVWIAALSRQYDSPLISRDHHFDSVPGLLRIGW